MLIELRVRDFAIIDNIAVRLEPGLNVLTGETGAGKSLIVGALSLLLGERASAETVRTGAPRATVEGVFDAGGRPELLEQLALHGIDAEDALIILRREVAAEGRSRAWINGAASTATLVGEIGRQLVDLHGQHEHQTLLRAEEQRRILDAYAGQLGLADEVAAAYQRVRTAARELDELERRRSEVAQRADFLRHQVEEIERVAPRAGEEQELEAEAVRLEHAEELSRLARQLHTLLYQADDSVPARLDACRRALERLIAIDAGLAEWREVVDSAYYGLEELGRRMGDYAMRVELDPARLDAIRRRQDQLFRLKSKYAADVAGVLEVARAAREQLDALDRSELDRKEAQHALDEAAVAHRSLCERLSAARADAARRLSAEITTLLPELGMPDGGFATGLIPHDAGATGAEDVEFRVALNAGFERRPLARVASGGELSRVMLAIKSVLARVDRVPSLVFDEIDAGIGGRVAHRVAEKLEAVAAAHQVFVITHLAQIASRADHHLLVEKAARDGQVSTSVIELSGDARVRELARLLGGDPESAASIEHAREMLGSSAA